MWGFILFNKSILMKKLLKNRKASPLLEEGLLLGIAAVAFSVVLSIVAGVLLGIKGYYSSFGSNMGNSLNDILKQIGDILYQIGKWLGIG